MTRTSPSRAPGSSTDGLPILQVSRLTVGFDGPDETAYAVRDVSFEVAAGRTLGIVGESGSGKSMTLRAVLGLLPPPGRIVEGSIRFAGRELVGAPRSALQAVRGREIGMVFQEPIASLNPLLSIGDQLQEVLRVKLGIGRRQATETAVGLLSRVGIRQAGDRLGAYPHQFSGGMAQRVMIAISIAANPSLLLADEPTTALDVSVQDQVLALLGELQQERGMSMVIVSHDMGVIARVSDEIVVMYASRELERGPTAEILRQPRHPYTRMLLASIPDIRTANNRRRLPAIPGRLPDGMGLTRGCPFAPRCPSRRDDCDQLDVLLDVPSPLHGSACPFV